MNPYHAVTVAQHNESLILIARSANARAAAPAGHDRRVIGRLRAAAANVWSLAAGAPTVLPRLHSYPTSTNA